MKRKFRVFSILLSILLVFQFTYTVNSDSIPVPQFNILGSIGGPTAAVAVNGDYVYVGKGASVIVLENSEGILVQRGKQLNLPTLVSDIKIEGETLYVAAGSSGLHIIDISDPLNPIRKSAFTSSGFAETVEIKDMTAYLANGSEGLQIIDVTYPEKPALVGQVYKDKYAFGIAVVGSYAYIAAANDGLLIADIAQSNAPKELISYDTPGIARDIAVYGEYAYVADDWKGISVIDVSIPAEPVSIVAIKTEGRIFGIALDGNYLYAADADMGLRVFDATDAAVPVAIASYMSADSNMTGVVVYNGTVFCVDRVKGILSFAVSSPEDLKLQSSYSQSFPIQSIHTAVKGRYAYITFGESGFSVVDLEDPADPQPVAHLDFAEAVSFIQIRGSYAYLPAENHLYTVDISDPQYPVCLTETMIGADEPLQGVDIDSDCIYLVDGSHIKVFSLKDPAEPVLIVSYYTGDPMGITGASDIAVRNGIAYVARGYEGICIYDASDADSIKYLGKYTGTGGYFKNIDFYDNLALIRISDINEIEILDISDIRNPLWAGKIEDVRSKGSNYKMGMYENYVLLPDDLAGIRIVDVSNLADIKQVALIDTIGIPVSVHVEGDKAYGLDSLGIMSIIDISIAPVQVEADKTAYITIDDGPSRNNTIKILDTLKEYEVKATFFVLPKDNMKDIYKRILGEGHSIGNHSYSHDYDYMYGSAEEFRKDILRARSFIYNKLNYTSTVFRFPGGTMGRNKDMIKERADILAELGYTYFDWDISTADTDPNLKRYGDEEYIVNLLANNVINNTKGKKKLVILMHDSVDKTYTAKALTKIIEGLKKQGYKFDLLDNY